MRRNLFLCACSTLIILLGSSCLSKDLYDAEQVGRDIELSFDFSTTVNCPVQMSVGRQALIHIYAENPEVNSNSPILYAAYTDKNGQYTGEITLAGEYVGKTVYACAYGICIPAKVSTGGITFNAAQNRSETRALEVEEGLCERLKKEFMDRLPEARNNTKQLEDVDNINLRVVTDGTEIMFTFISSGASTTSQIYYYYYPTGYNSNQVANQELARPGSQNYFYNEAKGYGDYELIINRFKKNKFLLTKGFGDNGNGYINSGCKTNFNADILFYGEDGNSDTGTAFPKGYSIGFFIVSSWADVYEPMFTDWWCNSHQNGGTKFKTNSWQHNNKQAVRFKDSASGKIIFGFEDIALTETLQEKCDFDFNDFLFLISTSPALDTEEIPELQQDFSESMEGTLLFEDLYPYEGDYDMNDVIIEYTWTKHFDQNNLLTRIDYEFTPVHDGADYISNFSLMIDNYVNTPIEIFKNHKSSLGQTFKGTLTGEVAGKKKDNLAWSDFNPFITVVNTNREVHLTKKKASANANQQGLNEYQKNYVSFSQGKAGEYPFAMNIARKGFTPAAETKRIDSNYPQYKLWVEAAGKAYTDWYNYYTKQ